MKKHLRALLRLVQGAAASLGRGFSSLGRTLRKPKWRHGRFSLLLLGGLTATMVLLLAALDTLEAEYGWRKDYSFNGYTTTGQETQQVVDRLAHPVTLYLLHQRGEADVELLEVLNRYGVMSPLITVEATDIAKNPGILTRFQGDMDSALEADSVVVSCEATGRYRVLGYYDFITQGYNMEEGVFEIAGLAYEKRLTEALAYVTEETVPLVGLLQSHGELTPQELEVFTAFLTSNNYDSRAISIREGDSLDEVDLLLIAAPQKDLTQEELAEINRFCQRGGSLLVTRDYTDPIALPNYMALLENYGVLPLEGVAVAGEADTGTYFRDPLYLIPYMQQLDMTLPLIAGNMDVLLLLGSSAFQAPPEASASLSAAAVLTTGPTAYVRNLNDGATGIQQQPGDITGEITLAVYAQRMHPSGDVSRMVALGSSAMLAEAYVYENAYNGEFLLQVLGELLPQKTISLDIMASTALRPGLRVGSQWLGILLMVSTPLLVLAAALCVLLPRRSR